MQKSTLYMLKYENSTCANILFDVSKTGTAFLGHSCIKLVPPMVEYFCFSMGTIENNKLLCYNFF